MIKAILVDDEPKALQVLKTKLTQLCPQIEITGLASSAKAAYDLITNQPPQLVFLDIAMPQMSGFDLLKQLPSLAFEVIFVTGFDDYAIQAIQFCAIGYIVKPIADANLIQAIENAQKRIALKKEHQYNRQLLENIAKPFASSNQIAIPTTKGIDFIQVKDILRLEAMERCTNLFLINQSSIVSSHHLGHFKKMLKGYHFFQTHRSHIVNLQYVSRYSRDGVVTLSDRSQVPISRRNKEKLLEYFR